MKKTKTFSKLKSVKSAKLPKNNLVSYKILAILIILTLLVTAGLKNYTDTGDNKFKKVYYGHTVRQAYHNEYKNLKPALSGLGLEEKDIQSICNLSEIATDGYAVEKKLLCDADSENYVVATKDNRDRIVAAAKQLDELTTHFGGYMSTNAKPTFEEYFRDVTNGVDYYPDITATFVRGNYLCAVAVFVAYANPNPPAYSIKMVCNSPLVTDGNNYLYPSEEMPLD